MPQPRRVRRAAGRCTLALSLGFAAGGCADRKPPAAGAVVEACAAGEAAAVAGLQPGDIVLEWQHGRASGDVGSPYHLAVVEQELAPHGPVQLLVRHQRRLRRVEAPTGRWGVRLRPALPPEELERHLRARELVAEGDLAGAVREWSELAAGAARDGRGLAAAWLLTEAAVAQARTGDGSACRVLLEEGAAAVRDRWLLAAYWERAGDALLSCGQTGLAAECFEKAVALLEEATPTSPAVAFALLQLCRTDHRAHEEDARHALDIYRRAGGRTVELATAISTVAVGAYFRSDLDAAEAGYVEALEIIRAAAPGSPIELNQLANLGLIAKRRGDFVTARAYYERTLEAAEALGTDTDQYANTSNLLGVLAKEMGRYDRARRHYEQALAAFRTSRPGGVEEAGVLNNLGNLALDRSDLAAARRYHQRALALRQRLDADGTDLASSLHNVGAVARRQGDAAGARRYLERALELKRRTHPGTPWFATTLYELGELEREQGALEAAAGYHERALEIRRAVAPEHPDVAASLHQLGAIALARGRPDAAEALWRDAVRLLAAQHHRLGAAAEQRAYFSARHRSPYLDLARLLADQGRAAEAWGLLEEARAGALRAIVAGRAAAPVGVPHDLWFARVRAESAVERLQGRLSSVDPVQQAETLQRYREALAAAEAELLRIDEEIRRAAPRLAALQAAPALGLAELRRALDPGTVVLSYAVGDESALALVTGAEADGGPAIRAFDIPLGEAELRGRVDRFTALIGRGRSVIDIEPAVLTQGRRLFELLVAPAWDVVAPAERLLVVPDGPLVELPFAALARPGEEARFLGHEIALFVSSSASLAVELGSSSKRQEAHPEIVVAFGDPAYPPRSPVVAEHGLCPLPGSRTEVEAIQRLFGSRASVFVGRTASEANLREHGRRADILHLAVHARLDREVPMDSALFFSVRGGRADPMQDGVLAGWDIVDGVHVDAGLVVLSSCSTGRGRVLPGEGVIGLARAFQVAGARTLLVSQWEVPDRATAALMTAFYDELRNGSSTAEALRRARLHLAGQDAALAHPFSWASFEVRGDWR